MGSGMDDAKGRIKEAAGDLTEDEDLKREGQLDQAGAAVKKKAENIKDKVDDMIDRGKAALDRDR
jgi:uncharacterized protein YjbJ (UPF0337 family)